MTVSELLAVSSIAFNEIDIFGEITDELEEQCSWEFNDGERVYSKDEYLEFIEKYGDKEVKKWECQGYGNLNIYI